MAYKYMYVQSYIHRQILGGMPSTDSPDAAGANQTLARGAGGKLLIGGSLLG